MLVKVCKPPRGGGSAIGAVDYILGYTMGEKGANNRDSIAEMMDESLRREDLGVGAVWRPLGGAGTRPSAIYAHGVGSLATASIELQAVAEANNRLRSGPVQHVVFAFGRDIGISDEDMLAAVHEVLRETFCVSTEANRLVGEHELQYVATVHRDTDDPHVHVVLGKVSPRTLRVHEFWQVQARLEHAARTIEWRRHLVPEEHGLYVADAHGAVTASSPAERREWRLTKRREHVAERVRRLSGDHSRYHDPESWCKELLAGRLRRDGIGKQESLEYGVVWADMHLIATTEGAELVGVDKDSLMVRLLERSDKGELQPNNDLYAIPFAELIPRYRELDDPDRDDMLRHLRDYHDAAAADEQFRSIVMADPSYVTRRIIDAGKAVFTRDDLAAYISDRYYDQDRPFDELVAQVEQRDATLRMLSPDTDLPLYTTTNQLAVEYRAEEAAKALAGRSDRGFRADLMAKAVAATEQARGYAITEEQGRVLAALRERFIWVQGGAGTGKSTTMEVVARYARLSGRQALGFTTAESPARDLAAEAGIPAYNLARAESELAAGNIAPKKNDIYIVDEHSMVSFERLQPVLDLAVENDATVVIIGDAAQLPNIAAGSPSAVLSRVAHVFGCYHEIRKVVRQRDPRHARANESLNDAIRTYDRAGVSRALGIYEELQFFKLAADYDAAIDTAAARYLELVTQHGDGNVLGVAASNNDCDNANKIVRDVVREATPGDAREALIHVTNGDRRFAVGDQIIVTENEPRKKGLRRKTLARGDRGVVTFVDVDCSYVVVDFPNHQEEIELGRNFRSFDYGWFTTLHKSQGKTVEAAVAIASPSVDAKMLYVAASRTRGAVDVIVPQTVPTRNGPAEVFPTIERFKDHVAEHIRVKDSALVYEDAEARYGGPDSVWAKSIKRALSNAADPLRVQHTEYLVERDEEYRRQLKMLRTKTVGPESDRKALAAFASRAKALQRKFKPLGFVEWGVANAQLIIHDAYVIEHRPWHLRVEGAHGRSHDMPTHAPIEQMSPAASITQPHDDAQSKIDLYRAIPTIE